MNKLALLNIPEFNFGTAFAHPKHPSLRIIVKMVKEEVDDIEIKSDDLMELITQRALDGNMAAWFRTTIIVSSLVPEIVAHETAIAHCTDESFDHFMENPTFLEVVEELTQDIIDENQTHPDFFKMIHDYPKMVS